MSGGSSAIRRRIIKHYGWNKVRDRERIRRWLPKLYVAWSRRFGWHWAYTTLGGWLPAMRVTERGAPPGLSPYSGADFWGALQHGTSRRR